MVNFAFIHIKRISLHPKKEGLWMRLTPVQLMSKRLNLNNYEFENSLMMNYVPDCRLALPCRKNNMGFSLY